jgi:hypothetical protein
VAPGPDGEIIDLGYVACVLRVVDFAHISRGRAPRLERLLRRSLPSGSAVHWDAQANITGPLRQGDLLVFGNTEPIKGVDAWWLFHDLAARLDAEIKSVHDYLRNRTVSATRFSLLGVKGVEDPAVFNQYVQLPSEVVPIDVRVQPDSMERVVWPGTKPEYVNDSERLISLGGSDAGVIACSQGIAIHPEYVADMAGLVDLGPVELTPSRESTADPEEVRPDQHAKRGLSQKVISDIRPAIVNGMDQLDTFGMMAGRLRFVRGLAKVYGQEVLEATKLRWIPLTEPPGNLVHRSKEEFEDALRRHNRIVLCTGLSAGGAYKAALSHMPAADLGNALVIATGSIQELKVDFDTKQRFKHTEGRTSFTGSLDEVVKLTHGQDETERSIRSEVDLVLTDFFIKCVADAWGTSTQALGRQQWHVDSDDDVLWANLKKE